MGRPTRIFFASDIHGSEVTYRKFLSAATRYEVDMLIFGGDLMGKALVPIVRTDRSVWKAHTSDGTRTFTSEQDLSELKANLGALGLYWWEGDADEYDAFSHDAEAVEAMFERAAAARLESWISLADERLKDSQTRAFLCGGNDDTDALLLVLEERDSSHVIACDNRVVPLDDQHEMVTVGFSTPTPWNTPRERTDDIIAAEIDRLVGSLDDPSRCIFNFHAPPLNSTLDRCMKLDSSTWPPSPVMKKGQPVYVGVGSAAVDSAIRSYNPVAGLHGHIHESRGVVSIGNSLSFNAGSEYSEGILRGLILVVRDNKVEGYQFTSG